jgi:hypothetical protein
VRLIRRRTGGLSLITAELSGETSWKKQGSGRIYQGSGLIIQGIYRRFTGKPLGLPRIFDLRRTLMVRSARPISSLPEIGTTDAQVGYSRPACASRTMGRLHRSRPRPVLREGAARLLRTRMSPHEKLSTPGAIPTVDFLLHDFGRFVKKPCVKTLVRPSPTGAARIGNCSGSRRQPTFVSFPGGCLPLHRRRNQAHKCSARSLYPHGEPRICKSRKLCS